MSNAAGTIPVAVQEIRRKLNAPGQYIQHQLDRIETDARELMQMAIQLRESLQAGTPERIDIQSLLSSVRARIADEFPAMSLDLQLPPFLPQIRGIHSQLREVFLNLARNATEATLPDPAHLAIRAHLGEEGRFLEIEFSDTGRGIQPEHKPRIFDLGFTTKPRRGMGFGLWWCQTVLRSQGGDIRLESSQPAVGTTFVVRLPVAQEQ
jgi:signal transduction histidine kinase